jgi:DnaJ family protein A protein 2
MGPGIYSQSQAYCDDCKGDGKTIKKENMCKECKGQKILVKKESVEVPIQPGIPNKAKIQISGKGNEHPEYRTGDLFVIVNIKNDPNFRRVKDDLHINKTIGLIEALSGFKFNLKHLSDLPITLSVPAKTTVSHLDVMQLKSKGMPKYKESMSFGDLYVHFEVQYPKNLNEQQLTKLREVLPKGLLPQEADNKNVFTLEKTSLNSKQQHQQNNHNHGHDQEEDNEEDYEDEGGHGGHGQKVECNHQ